MFLLKLDGPRSIPPPDGAMMTRGDLPPPTTTRWVASHKNAVITAVLHGLLEREEALEIYNLSSDELAEWEHAVVTFGHDALKPTTLQRHLQP